MAKHICCNLHGFKYQKVVELDRPRSMFPHSLLDLMMHAEGRTRMGCRLGFSG